MHTTGTECYDSPFCVLMQNSFTRKLDTDVYAADTVADAEKEIHLPISCFCQSQMRK